MHQQEADPGRAAKVRRKYVRIVSMCHLCCVHVQRAAANLYASQVASIVLSVFNTLGAVLANALIDRVGRRKLLLVIICLSTVARQKSGSGVAINFKINLLHCIINVAENEQYSCRRASSAALRAWQCSWWSTWSMRHLATSSGSPSSASSSCVRTCSSLTSDQVTYECSS